MLLSDIIQKLQEFHDLRGDMRVTCTILDSGENEDSDWGQDFVAIEFNDVEKDDLYCDIIMETNAAQRAEREEKEEEA